MKFTKIRIFSKNLTEAVRRVTGKGISAMQWSGENFLKAKVDWLIVDGFKYRQS